LSADEREDKQKQNDTNLLSPEPQPQNKNSRGLGRLMRKASSRNITFGEEFEEYALQYDEKDSEENKKPAEIKLAGEGEASSPAKEKTDEEVAHLSDEGQRLTFKDVLVSFFKTAIDPKLLHLSPLFVMSGIYLAFVISTLYRIVLKPLSGEDERILKVYLSYMWIVYTVSSQTATHFCKALSTQRAIFLMKIGAVYGLLILVYGFFADPPSYFVTLVYCATFGFTDVTFIFLVSTYLSESFPGQVEPYAVFKEVQNLMCCLYIYGYVYVDPKTFAVANICVFSFCSLWFILFFK
jgi:hypothetical protein